MSFLKDYYRVSTTSMVLRCLWEDFLMCVFLNSGSGLCTSLIKGVVSRLFIHAGFPILIGKRFRIRHPSNITIGRHCIIKHDVSIIADGPLVVGDNFIIGEGSTLSSYGPGLRIGNNVLIASDCYIAQHGGRITIGNNVLIGDGVRLYSLNHLYTAKKILIKDQGCQETTLNVKDNVWIGSGAVIFNNVTIGSGSVIGANTVVRKHVPPHVVFAGNPGKVIKKI